MTNQERYEEDLKIIPEGGSNMNKKRLINRFDYKVGLNNY